MVFFSLLPLRLQRNITKRQRGYAVDSNNQPVLAPLDFLKISDLLRIRGLLELERNHILINR